MKYIVVDVREPQEFDQGHVKGAINVPPSMLMSADNGLGNIPKDSNIIVYCVTGSRSNVAKHILEQQGFKNIINGINKDQVRARYQL